MDLPSKIIEQIAYNTIDKIEEHMLIVMDESAHEQHLSKSLQTNNKQFKLAVTFLTGYYGIFNVTNKNNKIYFTKPINDEEPRQVTTLPCAYELENLDKEIKRVIIQEGHYTDETYRFII